MKKVLLLLFGLVLFLQCEKEIPPFDCSETINYGQMGMTSEARSHFPYGGFEKLIFVDTAGNTHEFSIRIDTIRESIEKQELCDTPNSFYTNYKWTGYELNSVLTSTINPELVFRLKLYVAYSDLNPSFPPSVSLLLDIEKWKSEEEMWLNGFAQIWNGLSNPLVTQDLFLPEFNRHGKKYSDVELNITQLLPDKFLYIFYQKENGIVGFTDNFEKFWVLDRME